MNGIICAMAENSAFVAAEIEKILDGGDKDYKVLFDAMSYGIFGGGKRIRPTITLEFTSMLGAEKKTAVLSAAAVEMVHCYSLIHDDLPCMDNDDFRRGKPTNHKVFGEAGALLAGDALLTHAFSVLANDPNISVDKRLENIRILSEKAGIFGMVGGQQLDLIGEKEKISLDLLLKTHKLKTGALITASALIGCICAGGNERDRVNAEIYSENIGLAFQVIDDILDSGKEDGKTTFLDFYSEEEAKKYAENLTRVAINSIKDYKNNKNLIELATYLLKRKI